MPSVARLRSAICEMNSSGNRRIRRFSGAVDVTMLIGEEEKVLAENATWVYYFEYQPEAMDDRDPDDGPVEIHSWGGELRGNLSGPYRGEMVLHVGNVITTPSFEISIDSGTRTQRFNGRAGPVPYDLVKYLRWYATQDVNPNDDPPLPLSRAADVVGRTDSAEIRVHSIEHVEAIAERLRDGPRDDDQRRVGEMVLLAMGMLREHVHVESVPDHQRTQAVLNLVWVLGTEICGVGVLSRIGHELVNVTREFGFKPPPMR